jgi:anion-transporting  ArsA/GET3 family ATPase
MVPLLERKLILVTGKGGVGKSTVACAIGLLAARRGLRTIVAELSDQHRLPALFDRAGDPKQGLEIELERNLWSTSIDPDKALIEWLQTLGGRLSVRMLAASSTFQYFAAAAPGAKELVSMVKVNELCEAPRKRKHADPYDLVVLDAPATGHALAMLRSPQTFASIVRAGPLAEQAQRVRELLEDPVRTGYLAVAQATEMAVSETLELEQGLRLALDRDLDAILVNGTLPRRFSKQELAQVLDAASDGPPLMRSAARTAHTAYERSRVQRNQLARLRRQRFADGEPPTLLSIPFAFVAELDLTAVTEIAESLEKKLEQ